MQLLMIMAVPQGHRRLGTTGLFGEIELPSELRS